MTPDDEVDEVDPAAMQRLADIIQKLPKNLEPDDDIEPLV